MDMDNSETRFLILATGIAALNAFVQTNWTGPLLDWSVSQVVLSSEEADKQLDDRIHQHCLGALSVDSEPVYHLTERLGLLLIARELLLAVRKQHNEPAVALWTMRAVFLQQQLLDNPTGTLQSLLLEELAKESDAFERDTLRVRQQLDVALIESYYGLDKEACNMMQQAQKTSGFQWELTGALGRRTKFQTFDVSQLVLLAESKNEDAAALKQDDDKVDEEDRARPETVALEDDTLLDQVAFTENEKNERDQAKRHGNLQVIDQCLLLAFCLNVKNTNQNMALQVKKWHLMSHVCLRMPTTGWCIPWACYSKHVWRHIRVVLWSDPCCSYKLWWIRSRWKIQVWRNVLPTFTSCCYQASGIWSVNWPSDLFLWVLSRVH